VLCELADGRPLRCIHRNAAHTVFDAAL